MSDDNEELGKVVEQIKEDPHLFKNETFKALEKDGLVDAEFLELLQSLNPAELDMYMKMMPGVEGAAFHSLVIVVFRRLFDVNERKQILNDVEAQLTKTCDVGQRIANVPGIGSLLKSMGADTNKIARVCARVALGNLIRKIDGKV